MKKDIWANRKLGDIADIIMGQSPNGNSINDTEGIEFHQGKLAFGDKYLEHSNNYTSKPTKIALAHSLLLCVRAPIGTLNVTEREVCIGRGLCAINANNQTSNPFLYYALSNQQNYFEENATGSMFKAISTALIKGTRIPLPPLDVQQAIVNYLDKKTGQIDKSISLLEAQKADLLAYRKAIISETVTKGLNPNVNLKDSGISWIGETPEHWTIIPLKRCAIANSGKEVSKEIERDAVNAVPVYGSGGVFKYTNNALYCGEAVMFGRKGTIGKPLYVNAAFWAVDTMYFITHNCECLLPKYNYYQFLVFDWNKFTTQTALPSIVANDIMKSNFSIPPISEQQAIVDYLDSKTAKIDEAIRKIDEQISDLRSYRTALISEAVTGKIDVRP